MEMIKKWLIMHYNEISLIVGLISMGFFIIFAFMGNDCLEEGEEK